MAFDRDSIYVTWLFAINGTDEVAQTGVHLAYTSPTNPVGPAFAEIDDTTLQDFWTEMNGLLLGDVTMFATYGRAVGVKAAHLDTQGRYVTEPKLWEAPSPAAGNRAEVPGQCAVVLGLRSGQTFGRANYGRMYLPYCRPPLASNSPFIDPTSTNGISAAGADFIAGVNTIASGLGTGDLGVSIMSSVGLGGAKSVTDVAVDNLIDTQRRRIKQLTSTYVVSPVA